jgi:hypothetical protein
MCGLQYARKNKEGGNESEANDGKKSSTEK